MSDDRTSQQLRRIVVKVGTRLVTHQDGAVDHDFMSALAAQMAELREQGIEVILVTSGAVNSIPTSAVNVSGTPWTCPDPNTVT